jgi:hypothetical protein
VPDEVWAEVAGHYSEQELAALVLWVATANLFNRLNATTKQVAGAWHWTLMFLAADWGVWAIGWVDHRGQDFAIRESRDPRTTGTGSSANHQNRVTPDHQAGPET